MKPSQCCPSGPNLTAVGGPNQNARIKGTIYDGQQDWEMWNAWANGDVTQTDEYIASRWREQSAQIDLDAIRAQWTDFCMR